MDITRATAPRRPPATALRPGLATATAVFGAVLDDLAERSDNRFTFVLGPSGSGRSTLLEHLVDRRRPDQYIGAGRVGADRDMRAPLGDALGQIIAQILAQRPGSRDARHAAEGAALFSASAVPHLDGYARATPGPPPDLWPGFREVGRLINVVLDGLPGRAALLLIDDLDHASLDDQRAFVNAVTDARRLGLFLGLGATSMADLRHDAAETSAITVVELGPLTTDDVTAIAAELGIDAALTPDGAEALRAWSGSSASVVVDLLERARSLTGPLDRAAVERLVAERAGAAEAPPAASPSAASAPAPPGSVAAEPSDSRGELPTLPPLTGTARRYLTALVRLGPDATAQSVARALGDTSRFGAEGSAFAPVLGDLVARGLILADAGGRLMLAEPDLARALLTQD